MHNQRTNLTSPYIPARCSYIDCKAEVFWWLAMGGLPDHASSAASVAAILRHSAPRIYDRGRSVGMRVTD